MFKIFKKLFLVKKLNFEKNIKKDVILYDVFLSELLEKIILKDNFYVLYTRFEYINLRIFFKLLLSFKLNTINYICEIINEIQPKLVITFADNDEKFWCLKKKINNNKIKFVLIQNGWRTDIFKSIKSKKKNYYVDDMFFFNKNIAGEFKKNINGNSHLIGSFKNNFYQLKKMNNDKSSKTFLYISQISPYKKNINEFKRNYDEKIVSWKEFYESDLIVLKFIAEYCEKKRIKLNILGRNYINRFKEKEIFSSFLPNHKFEYLEHKYDFFQYDEINYYDLLVSIDSTLGYEAIARNIKTCFFSIRGNILELKDNDLKFGWPGKIKDTGFFWTNEKNFKMFEKIIDQVNTCSNDQWLNETKGLTDQLMIYSRQNKILSDYLIQNDINTLGKS